MVKTEWELEIVPAQDGQGREARSDRLLVPAEPTAIRIVGSRPIPRTFHQDARGFLIETMRADDREVRGSEFQMSYLSLTVPGQFRDADRWHVHRVQTDRFVVVLGEMILAMLDDRPDSPSFGRLEVVRMCGMSSSEPTHSTPLEIVTHLVAIPPGVMHCIANLGSEPFLLQNYPTELYNPGDEGRVLFATKVVRSLDGPFSWGLVKRSNGLS